MYRFLQIIGYRLNLFEEYFLNNYRHRTDGPAVIHYDIDEYSFWVNSTIRDKEAKKVIKQAKKIIESLIAVGLDRTMNLYN